MEKKIGINQRISIQIIEMAMNAAINGDFTSEFASDLASGEYEGSNRIRKARSIIGKLTERNPLFDFIKENKKDYYSSIKHKGDRALIFTALINAVYVFGYDTTVLLGKFFHVQDDVSSQLLRTRLSSIYASNRSLPNAIYCIMPMYIEAGLLNRPKVGNYSRNYFEDVSQFTRELYIKSFLVHNPMVEEIDLENMEHPYFEFLP